MTKLNDPSWSHAGWHPSVCGTPGRRPWRPWLPSPLSSWCGRSGRLGGNWQGQPWCLLCGAGWYAPAWGCQECLQCPRKSSKYLWSLWKMFIFLLSALWLVLRQGLQQPLLIAYQCTLGHHWRWNTGLLGQHCSPDFQDKIICLHYIHELSHHNSQNTFHFQRRSFGSLCNHLLVHFQLICTVLAIFLLAPQGHWLTPLLLFQKLLAHYLFLKTSWHNCRKILGCFSKHLWLLFPL